MIGLANRGMRCIVHPPTSVPYRKGRQMERYVIYSLSELYYSPYVGLRVASERIARVACAVLNQAGSLIKSWDTMPVTQWRKVQHKQYGRL
jgi:hypothetical protein